MLDEKRILELLAEARTDLSRYDDLRNNTLEMIATYERRLSLLGADVNMLPLPGVEQPPMKPKPHNGMSNTALFEAVLNDTIGPMTAKEVWVKAALRGAQSSSLTPDRVADAVLREMATKGRIALAGPGRYQKKNGAAFPA
jgi:hypothetical protein